MKTALISWVATNNDFSSQTNYEKSEENQSIINQNGPHFSLYESFMDFDEHYLLIQDDKDSRLIQWQSLANELKRRYESNVYLKSMNLHDVTDVGAIKSKIDDLLIELEKQYETIEIFISPGSPAMQIAWYLLGIEKAEQHNIKFFKRRPEKYSKTNENEYLSFESSNFAKSTNVREITYNDSSKIPYISESLKEVYDRGYQVAGNNKTTVLIHGETGTGKEYLAKYIHDNSHRKNQPYVKINCGAYRGELLESRLFGFEKGAFTGAMKQTKGAFEDADGGTIFLDEIGDISPRMQVALLRVLEEKTISRIGSTNEIKVDVRVIAASNKKLWKLCIEKKFRYDLYYRLAIVELTIPSFREFSGNERKSWIEYYIESMYTKLGKRYLKNISKDLWNYLLNYPFYGNLREVRNAIESIYTFSNEKASIDDLPKWMIENEDKKYLKLDDFILRYVNEVVEFCGGNLTKAGEILDISRTTVRKYYKKN